MSPFFEGGVNQLGSADREPVVSDLAEGECSHFSTLLSSIAKN
jgi:hypothetical protein